MLSRFSAARSDAADRRALSGIEGAGEYGIGRFFSRRSDHVIHTTGCVWRVWTIADREPVSFRCKPENSGRMPSLSKLAIPRLCRDGDAGSGECGERRKDCRRYSRTGSYSAGGRSEEHTSELQSHSDLVCRLLLEKK